MILDYSIRTTCEVYHIAQALIKVNYFIQKKRAEMQQQKAGEKKATGINREHSIEFLLRRRDGYLLYLEKKQYLALS